MSMRLYNFVRER